MTAKSKPATPELRAIFKAALISEGSKYQVARDMNTDYGISQAEAIEIYYEIKRERTGIEAEEMPKRLAAARTYANNYVIGHRRLREMFSISCDQAAKIAKEAASKRAKRNEVSRMNQDAARAYLFVNYKDATTSDIAKRFKLGVCTARRIIEEIREAVKRKQKEQKPTRIVRRFRDLSGTDATADERRYPSGIGFGVVEVIRNGNV